MEALFALVALALAAAIVASPVLAILALNKARKLEARLNLVEKRQRQGEDPGTRVSPAPRVEQAELPFQREPGHPATPVPAPAPSEAASVERPRPIEKPTATPARGPAPVAQPPGSPPAPPTPVPAKRPAPPRKPHREIQWEQWIGIRGAAVVGGLLFALAGLLFFKHAFDRGWITPAMRVVTGIAVGLAAIGASEVFRRKQYRFAPAAAAGGGVVVLYATTWASYRLYEFTSALAALPLMALVTATCAWLSVRFRSQLVAILGLVGGFATPLLLSIQADHPIGLFGYLLLLDLGLLGLGQRMKWPSLGILGMLGTFLVELIWTLQHLDTNFFPLALGSLGAFALIFAAAGLRAPASERRRWFMSQVGALLLPFAFATYFAALADFGEALWPLALLVAFLAVGAGWVGAKQKATWLVTGAAAGALAVTGTWLVRTGVSDGGMWEFAASTLGLVVVFMGVDKLFGRSPSSEVSSRWAAPVSPAIVGVGFSGLTVIAAIFHLDTSPWPWLLAALGHGILLHVQGGALRAGPLRLVGAGFAGIAMALHLVDVAYTTLEGVPGSATTVAWMMAAPLVLLALAADSSRRDDDREAQWSWHAAAVFPLILLAALPPGGALMGSSPALALGVTVALAGLALAPSLVKGWSGWYVATLSVYLVRRGSWLALFLQDAESAAIAGDLFLLEAAALALLAAAPLTPRLSRGRLTWAGAGLFLLFAIPNVDRLLEAHFDPADRALAPALLAAMVLALAAAARFRLNRGSLHRDSATRWLLGVGTLLSSLAFALYVDHDAFFISTALTGLGLAVLWRSLPSLGLKFTSLAFFTASTVGLVAIVLAGLAGQEHFMTAPRLVWNWTSYATGVPALCALAGAYVIGTREREFATNAEQRRPLRGRAWMATMLGLAAVVLAFIWLNLQVFVYFEPSGHLRLDQSYGPARDLALSICWILYALLLLAIGMARSASGLRQISLAFLLLTLMKVFLHDLGDLQGLYRVGSLFGLAISLLLVSLLYQRFVFPRRSGAGEAVEAGVS